MRYPKGLGVAVCGLLAAGTTEAAVIGPQLERHLAAGDHEPVPIILTLRGRVETATIRGADRGDRRRRVIETLRSGAERLAPLERLLSQAGATDTHTLWIAHAVAAKVPPALIPLLAARPDVERIRLDVRLQLAEPGSGEPTPAEWNLYATRAPELWSDGYTGGGVTIGGMDTGSDYLHPDLATRWRGGHNSWFDATGRHRYPHDSHGHGTQTLSLAVGGSAGGSAIGVAPGAQWIAARIFDDNGYARLSAIHRAFQWMLDPDGDPAVDDTPDVVLNAWSVVDPLEPCNREFEQDIQALRSAGVAVTFAAGNYGPDAGTSVSPANLGGTLATGAVDAADTVAWFSSRGPSACDGALYPAISAPGVSVKAADLTFGGLLPDSYVWVSGTSYSVAHTAGALALLREVAPTAGVDALATALTQSARDLGSTGADNDYGAGVIDLVAARDLLAAPPPAPVDGDGDGHPSDVDCDDTDPTIHPGAPEIRNDGIDQDCDGSDRVTEIGFAGDAYTVMEDSGPLTIEVVRSGDLAVVSAVDYATADGTATAGIDYAQRSGTLLFAPQVASAVITIPVHDNDDADGERLFSLSLSGASEARLAGPAVTSITIEDDEPSSPPEPAPTDADGDGHPAATDCDDSDPAVHPGATELKHDGIDQDCNGYDLTIDVTGVTYSARRGGLLLVSATSALAETAGLVLEGYGPMEWDSRRGEWLIIVDGVAARPATVTVSGIEGSTTETAR